MVAPAENFRPPKLTPEAREAFEADDPALQEVLQHKKAEQKIELRKMIQQYGEMAKKAKNDQQRETFERWQVKARKQLEELEK